MPKLAKAKKAPASKAKAIRGGAHKLPPPLPMGEIVTDVFKKQWRIGKAVGQGGFGLIYLASNDVTVAVPETCNYVIKIEPVANGPLFCEMHFYMRVLKSELVEAFKSTRKLKYLSVPKYIASGLHKRDSVEYRFIIMPRFGTDLQKLFVQNNRQFQLKDVCILAIQMLDALEFIHKHEYVHADIKAANILLGCHNGVIQPQQVYLVDYGLAYRYTVDGKHKEYKEDPTKAHDGTIEFTSRDAHRGVAPSTRGDLEILGYCLLQWLCSRLPWEQNLTNKNYVRDEKIRLMDDLPTLMKICFPKKKHPECIKKYLAYVNTLDYEHLLPDYKYLRSLFSKEAGSGSLNISGTTVASKTKGRKRKSDAANLDDVSSITIDSDLSPSPPKRPSKSASTNNPSGSPSKGKGGSGNRNQNAKISTTKPRTKTVVNKDTISVAKSKVAAAKKVARRSIIASKVTQKLSPRSTIPGAAGLRHSPRLISPRSIIPAASSRYSRPPILSELANGRAHSTPVLSPVTGPRKVKRSRKRGVEIAVQTSPRIRK